MRTPSTPFATTPIPPRDRAAIAGIGHTEFARDIGRPEHRTALEAILSALDDAGLSPADVDGLVKFTLERTTEIDIARNLGIPNLRYFSEVGYGGGSGCAAVGHAALAVAAGLAETVVVWRARNRGSGGRPWAQAGERIQGDAAWFYPFGLLRPVDQIAVLARAWLHAHQGTPDEFGAVAVAVRSHAARNPHALKRDPITLDDHRASRMVSDPLRVLDCCLESDGALAVVVTTSERARDLRHTPALVRGYAQGTGPQCLSMGNYFHEPLLDTPGAACAPELWRNAGCGPEDVDVAQIYDAFTPLVTISLEEYGFAKPGEGGRFALDGNLAWPDGALPTNTSGGSLSEAYVHGFNLILEGVRQIRGTSTCQVEGAEVALVTSGNGVPTSAMVLRAP